MNKIETLLKELCPNGITYGELNDVCEIIRGVRVTKKDLLPSGYPVVSGGTGYMGFIDKYNREPGTITIAQYGSAGYVNYQKERFWANDVCFSVYPNEKVLNKFLYHFLLNKQNYLYEISNRSAIPYSISKERILKIKIPIPPLEIQEEIVKILDKFTDYVTELNTELNLRQKQYNYYRDKLLSFENQCYKVVWRNLGDVATFNYGYTAKASESGEVRFIRITDINENGYLKVSDQKYIQSFTDVEKYFVKKGDLLMARTGATYGKTVYYDSDDNAVYASFLIKISPNPELNSRYYWHFSKSNLYWNQADKLVSKAGQPQFNANSLKNIKIPIPSLEIQSRIVQVLDNFDAVCNDLNIGLPKEIELRQKQYEFFRDKLLTFAAEGVYTDSTVQTRHN